MRPTFSMIYILVFFLILNLYYCYELGMCYPAARPGVEQCCSGEGYLALSSNLLATKQSIPTTPS